MSGTQAEADAAYAALCSRFPASTLAAVDALVAAAPPLPFAAAEAIVRATNGAYDRMLARRAAGLPAVADRDAA
jgi:hypothetical protein